MIRTSDIRLAQCYMVSIGLNALVVLGIGYTRFIQPKPPVEEVLKPIEIKSYKQKPIVKTGLNTPPKAPKDAAKPVGKGADKAGQNADNVPKSDGQNSENADATPGKQPGQNPSGKPLLTGGKSNSTIRNNVQPTGIKNPNPRPGQGNDQGRPNQANGVSGNSGSDNSSSGETDNRRGDSTIFAGLEAGDGKGTGTADSRGGEGGGRSRNNASTGGGRSNGTSNSGRSNGTANGTSNGRSTGTGTSNGTANGTSNGRSTGAGTANGTSNGRITGAGTSNGTSTLNGKITGAGTSNGTSVLNGKSTGGTSNGTTGGTSNGKGTNGALLAKGTETNGGEGGGTTEIKTPVPTPTKNPPRLAMNPTPTPQPAGADDPNVQDPNADDSDDGGEDSIAGEKSENTQIKPGDRTKNPVAQVSNTPKPTPTTKSGKVQPWKIKPDQKLVLPKTIDLSLIKDLVNLPPQDVSISPEQRKQIRELLEGVKLVRVKGLTKEMIAKSIEKRREAEKEDDGTDFQTPGEPKKLPPNAPIPKQVNQPKPGVVPTPTPRPADLPTDTNSPFRYQPWSPVFTARYEKFVPEPEKTDTLAGDDPTKSGGGKKPGKPGDSSATGQIGNEGTGTGKPGTGKPGDGNTTGQIGNEGTGTGNSGTGKPGNGNNSGGIDFGGQGNGTSNPNGNNGVGYSEPGVGTGGGAMIAEAGGDMTGQSNAGTVVARTNEDLYGSDLQIKTKDANSRTPEPPPHNYQDQKGIPGALILPPIPPIGTEDGTEKEFKPIERNRARRVLVEASKTPDDNTPALKTSNASDAPAAREPLKDPQVRIAKNIEAAPKPQDRPQPAPAPQPQAKPAPAPAPKPQQVGGEPQPQAKPRPRVAERPRPITAPQMLAVPARRKGATEVSLSLLLGSASDRGSVVIAEDERARLPLGTVTDSIAASEKLGQAVNAPPVEATPVESPRALKPSTPAPAPRKVENPAPTRKDNDGKADKEIESAKEVKSEKEVKSQKEVNSVKEVKSEKEVKAEKEVKSAKEVKADKSVKPAEKPAEKPAATETQEINLPKTRVATVTPQPQATPQQPRSANKASNSRGSAEGSLNPLPPIPLPDSDSEIGDGSGLRGEYYLGMNFDQYQFTRADKNLDLFWSAYASPNPKLPPGGNWSARWMGKIEAPTSGTYTLYATADDGIRVWVDHQLVIDHWTIVPTVLEHSAVFVFEKGKQYDFRVDYFQYTGPAMVGIYWEGPGTPKEYVPQANFFYPLPDDEDTLKRYELPK